MPQQITLLPGGADLTGAACSRFSFFVPGKPQTAGSKVSVPTKVENGVVVGRRIVESGDRDAKRSWRTDVRGAARLEIESCGWKIPPPTQGIFLEITLVRKRPSEHMGSGRNAGTIKERFLAARPTTNPDTTKMVRAIEDALTAIVWHDDSQVVDHALHKAFGDHVSGSPHTEGALITVGYATDYFGPTLSS